MPHTIKTLDQLRSIGVAIALDDFGTGYSSLASLQQLPLTRVKLDRSLIAGIDDSARSASIARATIGCAAAWVWKSPPKAWSGSSSWPCCFRIRRFRCRAISFSRPVPASKLLSLLEQLPAHCEELRQTAQKLPAQNQLVSRSGERRKGPLTLVVD